MKKLLTVLLTVMLAFTTIGINVLAETDEVVEEVTEVKTEEQLSTETEVEEKDPMGPAVEEELHIVAKIDGDEETTASVGDIITLEATITGGSAKFDGAKASAKIKLNSTDLGDDQLSANSKTLSNSYTVVAGDAGKDLVFTVYNAGGPLAGKNASTTVKVNAEATPITVTVKLNGGAFTGTADGWTETGTGTTIYTKQFDATSTAKQIEDAVKALTASKKDYYFDGFAKVADQTNTWEAKWLYIVDKPTAKTNLVYNGQEQLGVDATDYYTVVKKAGGDHKSAGSYKVDVTLKDGNVWNENPINKNKKTIEVDYTIAPQKVKAEALPTVVFTGSKVDIKVKVSFGTTTLAAPADYDVDYRKQGETATSKDAPINVGKYEAVITLKSGNYVFEKESKEALGADAAGDPPVHDSIVIPFEILPSITTVEIIADQGEIAKYDGNSHTAIAELPEGVKFADGYYYRSSATNAGTYTARVRLTDTTKYKWSDNTTGDKYFTWSIGKKIYTYAEVVEDLQNNLVYNGEEQRPIETLPVGLSYYNAAQLTGYTNSATNAGENYVAIIRINDDDNVGWDPSIPEANKRGTIFAGTCVIVPWSIAKKNAFVKVDNASKTYGDYNDPEYKFITYGFVEDEFDTIKNYIETKRSTKQDAGTYEVTAEINPRAIANYNVTLRSGYLTINKAKLTASLVIPEDGFVYDGKAKNPTVKIEGLVGSEIGKTLEAGKDYQVLYNYGQNDATSAGTQHAYVGNLSNDLSKNYVLDNTNMFGYVDLTYAIAKKKVNAVWADTEFTYDGEWHLPTVSTEDFVEGDYVGLYVNRINSRYNAGKYSASATLLGLDASNYEIVTDTQSTDFEILPKELELVWDKKVKFVYDKKEHAPFVTEVKGIVDNGFDVEGETVIIDYVEDFGKQVKPGKYTAKVELSGSRADNYVIKAGDESKDFRIYVISTPTYELPKTGVR